jgi:hypothetical protein
LASLTAAVAVSGASGSSSARTRPVHFTPLWRASGEGSGKWYNGPRNVPDGSYVVGRVADTQWLATTVISESRTAALDRFQWGKSFLLLAVIVRPTTGYTPTIRRIGYQRISDVIDQLCVTVDVKRPAAGAAVEHRRTVSAQAVAIPRRGFGLTVPRGTVTVDARGRILWKTSSYPLRPQACRG